MFRILLIVSVLSAFGAAMIGCHAEADVNPHNTATSVTMPR